MKLAFLFAAFAPFICCDGESRPGLGIYTSLLKNDYDVGPPHLFVQSKSAAVHSHDSAIKVADASSKRDCSEQRTL